MSLPFSSTVVDEKGRVKAFEGQTIIFHSSLFYRQSSMKKGGSKQVETHCGNNKPLPACHRLPKHQIPFSQSPQTIFTAIAASSAIATAHHSHGHRSSSLVSTACPVAEHAFTMLLPRQRPHRQTCHLCPPPCPPRSLPVPGL